MQGDSHLNVTLERAAQVRGISEMARAAAAAAALLIAGALAAVLADAVVGFDVGILLVIDAALIAGAVAGIAFVIRSGLRNRYDPRRMARLLETSLGIADSRLINAVELSAAAAAGSASLRAMAVDIGNEAVTQVKASVVMDRRGLKRGLLGVACMAAVMLAGWVTVPRLFATVVPRYLAPGADLPAFTFVEFKVDVDPERIYFGKPATIHATLSSPFALPEAATAVFDAGEGRRERVAMIHSDAGQFVLAIDRAELSRRFFVDTPQGRSDWKTLSVLPVPLFEKVTVRYDHPAYTGWAATERPLDARGVKALVGTTVTLTIQSNVSLKDGIVIGPRSFTAKSPSTITDQSPESIASALLNENDGNPIGSNYGSKTVWDYAEYGAQELKPSPENPKIVISRFTLTTTIAAHGVIRAADGTLSEKALPINITAIPDAPPQVQLVTPDLRIMVPEGFKVPVSVVASDDIGVKGAALHSRVNDRVVEAMPMVLTYRNPAYATGAGTLDMAAIGAKAGDTVRGFVTVFDNHPNPPQSADSPTFEIAVITEEQYKALAREDYRIDQLVKEMEKFQEQMQKIDEARDKLIRDLENLKKKMDASGGKLSDADKKVMERLLRDLDQYSKDSKAASEQMKDRASQPQLYEFEQPYADLLKKTAKEAADQAEAADRNGQALSKQPTSKNVEQTLKDLEKDRQRRGDPGEQSKLTQEQLGKLDQADSMMQGTEEILDLAERQKALAEKLSSYREGQALSPGDRERLNRLAEEQRQLQQQLHETTERLEKQAKDSRETLPKMSRSVRDIVEKIRELNVERDQHDAAEHGQLGRGYESSEYATSAAKKLGMMTSECMACSGAQSKDLDGALGLSRSKLSQAMEQMAQGRRGNRPGSKTGKGSSGQTGDSAGGQSSSTGGENNGKSTLLGPRSPKSSGQLGDKKHNAGAYNSPGKGPELDDSSLPQQVNPATREGDSELGGAGGVPLRYRGLAERYFRRLAQDGR